MPYPSLPEITLHRLLAAPPMVLLAESQGATRKLGTFNKRLKAAWGTAYLLKVLTTLFQ